MRTAAVAGHITPQDDARPVASVIPVEGERTVYAFPPTAILDEGHVAKWLGVSVNVVQGLPLRWIPVGRGSQRFRRRIFAADVVTFLNSLK